MPRAAPFRLGIVGAGAAGALHAAALRLIPELFSVVGIADPDTERGSQLAWRFGASVHEDHVAMAREIAPDVAIVASPQSEHHRQVIDLLESGISVLVEKPMALTTAECREMAAASAATGVPLVVGHMQRYLPRVASAVRLVDDGIIGDVRMIVDRISSRYEHGTRPGWFLDPVRSPGGILANLGCHIIDRLFVLGGGTDVGVEGVWFGGETVPTEVTATFTLANGAHAIMVLTGTGLPSGEVVEMIGTEGALRITPATGVQHLVRGETVADQQAGPQEDLAAFVAQLRDLHGTMEGASPIVGASYGVEVMAVIERIGSAFKAT